MNTCEAKWHITFFSHIPPVEDQQLQPPYLLDFLLEGGAWNSMCFILMTLVNAFFPYYPGIPP